MILFHLASIDSGDLRPWRRALLPAMCLRRAGVAAGIIVGAPRADVRARGDTIVFTGTIGGNTARWCRAARDAGLRAVIDIADARSMRGNVEHLRNSVLAADGLIAADDALRAVIQETVGETCPEVRIAPDFPVGSVGTLRMLGAFPAIAARLLIDAVRIRSVDLLRRLRRGFRRDRSKAAEGACIAWFGDGRELNDAGGLGELLLASAALVDLAPEVPFRLRVIGTSRRQFRRTIARLPIASEFRRLTLFTLAGDLKGADACLLPADERGEAGLSFRHGIARDLGLTVIGGTPRWPEELRGLLAGGGAARGPAVRSLPQASGGSAERAALDAWRAALAKPNSARADAAGQGSGAPAQPRRLRALFLLQQFQDLDLVCPLAEAACASDDFEVGVAVVTKVAVPAARRLGTLRAMGAQIRFWHAKDLIAGRASLFPGAPHAAVTASDGGGKSARCATAFVRLANARGAATLNLQHGLDNAGLTYGMAHGGRGEPFLSRFILTWGGFERLTAAASPGTRARVIPVGCTKRRLERTDVPDFPGDGRPIIAVFENLHWRRYDDAYRRRFVADLIATARAEPGFLFLLKPHMGGRWFSADKAGEALPGNLIVSDPAAPRWQRFTADAFLAHAAAVITTPSTIALDAARYGLPTAIVAYGIAADNYRPLARIEDAADWLGFVRSVADGDRMGDRVQAFHSAASLPGDAVGRSLDVIRLAAAGRSQPEILAELRAAPARA